jgi:predicted transcriptional regulator
MKSNIVHIEEDKLDNAIDVVRALAHNLRLQILTFIDKNGVINVNKIYNTLGLEQSITSQHLRILRLANIVLTERQGKQIFYSINYEYLQQVVGNVQVFLTKG